LNFTG